ncbi:MAG: DNA-processing protein DprA [Spirochaetia bacterium]
MDDLYALAIHLIPLLNPIEKMALAKELPDHTQFQKIKGSELFVLCGGQIKQTKHRISKFAEFSGQSIWEKAQVIYEKLQKRHIHITHLFREDYPALLREIYAPPFLLFYMGQLANPLHPALGVVGTRKPHVNTKNETAIFVREVAKSIGSIVSGMAIGIDGIAHRAALSVNAHTSAVLGSGFDFIYPNANKRLAVDIVHNGGALITEYPPETQPAIYTFPERNRIVAGLCRSLIVMEAPHRSGALITADFALEQGRDVFIHRIGLKPESGLEKLYEQGAIALERGADLLHSWGIMHKTPIAVTQKKEVQANVAQEPTIKKKNRTYDIGKLIAENTAQDIGWENDNDL